MHISIYTSSTEHSLLCRHTIICLSNSGEVRVVDGIVIILVLQDDDEDTVVIFARNDAELFVRHRSCQCSHGKERGTEG